MNEVSQFKICLENTFHQKRQTFRDGLRGDRNCVDDFLHVGAQSVNLLSRRSRLPLLATVVQEDPLNKL